jgi:apolipoprotein N-acyltransferase
MMNVFIAFVENRKVVLVSANSGISNIIELSGIIIDKTEVSKKMLNETFFQNDFKTFYTKCNDVFVEIYSIVLLVLVVFLCFKIRLIN